MLGIKESGKKSTRWPHKPTNTGADLACFFAHMLDACFFFASMNKMELIAAIIYPIDSPASIVAARWWALQLCLPI
jgi:hypothetical protein